MKWVATVVFLIFGIAFGLANVIGLCLRPVQIDLMSWALMVLCIERAYTIHEHGEVKL